MNQVQLLLLFLYLFNLVFSYFFCLLNFDIDGTYSSYIVHLIWPQFEENGLSCSSSDDYGDIEPSGQQQLHYFVAGAVDISNQGKLLPREWRLQVL